MKVGRTGKNSKPCSVMQAAMISWMRVVAASASSRLPGSISAVICSIIPVGWSATASGVSAGRLHPATVASARAASAAARAVRRAALMGFPPTSRPTRRARRVGREVGGKPMSAARRTALAAALAALALATVPGCSRPAETPDAVADQPTGMIEQITAEIDPGNLEDAEAATTRIQEIIAACMTEQGFEFFPVRPTFIDGQEQEDYLAEQLGVRPGTLEYAQRYGYGLSTHAYREMPEPSAPPNPNEQVLEAMSDAERQAWGSAMFGESQADDDLASQGCWGRASYEVYEAPPEGLDLEPFAPLQAEIDTMFGSLQNHPRQLDLDSRWMACMAEAGQPEFDSPADAIDSITAEWDGFRGIGPSAQVAAYSTSS